MEISLEMLACVTDSYEVKAPTSVHQGFKKPKGGKNTFVGLELREASA